MTLIVAMGCDDGIVIGADSASTDTATGTRLPVEKIRPLGKTPFLYGGSGDVGLLQKIEEHLASVTCTQNTRPYKLRAELVKSIAPEQNRALKNHAPYPAQYLHQPPAAELLFAGVLDKKPLILEIEKNGSDTIYGDEYGNFAAIGSGKPWAQAAFRLHLKTKRNLQCGKIFAYRVLEDSIDIAPQFLSAPIHLYTIDLDGNTEKVANEEIDALKDTCRTWKELEREAVNEILTSDGPTTTARDAEIPKPAK